MMIEPKKAPVTIHDIDRALTRAIESAQWAKQHDDEEALTVLKQFLDQSIHSRNDLFYYVASYSKDTDAYKKSYAMTRLPLETVAELYSLALDGGSKNSIVSCVFRGNTIHGSSIYDLNYTTAHPITLYIRKCRGGLRGELNEDSFTVVRMSPEPPRQEQKKRNIWQRLLDKL